MVEISIIIPVYNAERYIDSCINSVISDDMRLYEIILVDDGSEDASGIICDSYAQRYSNIKVCHIKNNGVSNARNVGVENARGQWIMFLDADDKLLCDVNELIDINKEHYDGIYFNYKRDEDKDNCVQFCGKVTTSENIILATLYRIHYSEKIESAITIKPSTLDACWAKLYKAQIIKEQGIRFDTELKLSEDTVFNLEYLLHTNMILCIDRNVYYYRDNEQSVCNVFRKDYIENRRSLINIVNNIPMNAECDRARNGYCICILLQLQRQIISQGNREYRLCFLNIFKDKAVKRSIKRMKTCKISSKFFDNIRSNTILLLWKIGLYGFAYYYDSIIRALGKIKRKCKTVFLDEE